MWTYRSCQFWIACETGIYIKKETINAYSVFQFHPLPWKVFILEKDSFFIRVHYN